MSRLLAADAVAVLQHVLQHISVAHAGLFDVDARLLRKFKEAHVAHDGDDSGIVGKFPLLLELGGEDGNQLVAVDQFAALVHRKAAVGVPVEGDTEVEAVFADIFSQHVDVGGAAVIVDVDAVWLIV